MFWPCLASASEYVIVTTSEIRNLSLELDAFADFKANRGFNVSVFDETDWAGAGLVGDAAAEALRSFLQVIHAQNGLDYVLLIGDPRSQIGPIPMKNLYPRTTGLVATSPNGWNANCNFSQVAVPSDYYYAELDGNWDLDGDGLPGEFGSSTASTGSTGDFGPGGIELEHEARVGRIPVYAHNAAALSQGVQDLDHILTKTMSYQDADPLTIGWRNTTLLAAEGANRFFWGEATSNEVLLPGNYTVKRAYDADVCLANTPQTCDPNLTTIPEATTCSVANVSDLWQASTPGIVSWLTHGGGWGAQAVMNASETMQLDDAYPVITFQASCNNSQPSQTNNLSYALLKNGAIATVGATAVSHGPGSPVVLNSGNHEAGNAGMSYHFIERIGPQGQSVGEALYTMKDTQDLYNRCWYWQNTLTFNLYGDPEIRLLDSRTTAVPSWQPLGLGLLILLMAASGTLVAMRRRAPSR
ncbi:MAG: C25 family cysteine peptidase [Myxococcota bacterium]|nr:C25 family cysteine peptidase [Myxococcota bacterium]